MDIKKNIILNRLNNKPILIDYFLSEKYDSQPLVIFCHGYKGFKDWGGWNLMARKLAEKGMCIVKFNFSHNGGTVDEPVDFPDLEAFGQNNYTKELDDLKDVIDWCQIQFLDNLKVNTENLALIGHSRGGGIAALKSYEDPRIKKLITLAGVSDFAVRFGSEREISEWKSNGVKYVLNGRTKQQMPHYYQFYTDYLEHRSRLNIKNAIAQLGIPHLIIHGDQDHSVSLAEAQAMHTWHPESDLVVVKNADHVFNIRHPWKQSTLSPEFKLAVNGMIAFILKKGL